MRYLLKEISGAARRLFKHDMAYDDRQITAMARKHNLLVTRPNRSTRIRGSARLFVWDNRRIVAKFERQEAQTESSVKPIPVGAMKGRLL